MMPEGREISSFSLETFMHLLIDGEVERPRRLSAADLAAIDAQFQVADVGTLDPKRRGQAVKLAGLLSLVGAHPSAAFLTLHSAADDFHASIPLAAVRDRAVLIYALDGRRCRPRRAARCDSSFRNMPSAIRPRSTSAQT